MLTFGIKTLPGRASISAPGVMALSLLLGLTACGDEETVGGVESKRIHLDSATEQIIVISNGEANVTGSVAFSADGDWSIEVSGATPSTDTGWLEVTPTSGGKGNHVITYNAKEPGGSASRSCVVKIMTDYDNQQFAICYGGDSPSIDKFGIGGTPSEFSSPDKTITSVETELHNGNSANTIQKIVFNYSPSGRVESFTVTDLLGSQATESVGKIYYGDQTVAYEIFRDGSLAERHSALLSKGKALVSYQATNTVEGLERLGRKYYYSADDCLTSLAAESYRYLSTLTKISDDLTFKWDAIPGGFNRLGLNENVSFGMFGEEKNDANLDLTWLCLTDSPYEAHDAVADIRILGWLNCLGQRSRQLPTYGNGATFTYEHHSADAGQACLIIRKYQDSTLVESTRINYL